MAKVVYHIPRAIQVNSELPDLVLQRGHLSHMSTVGGFEWHNVHTTERKTWLNSEVLAIDDLRVSEGAGLLRVTMCSPE